jgi:monoterpene epsilon-lactone hydrolase
MMLVNQVLRATVKPFLSFVSFDPDKLASRRQLLSGLAALMPLPGKFTITPFKLGPMRAEWIDGHKGEQENSSRVLLYLHGGGYLACSPVTHRNITTRLARLGDCRVLAIDYRKSPEYPFPYALEDSIFAYRWLLDQGYAPSDIIIGGDSAGGNLTLLTLLALRDRGQPLPVAAFGMSPWTDLSNSGVSVDTRRGRDPMIPVHRIVHAAQLHSNGVALDSPQLSPVFADLSGLPPLMVHVGDAEVLLSDAVRFVDRARNFGVEAELKVWANAPHVFQLFAGVVPQALQSLKEIAGFMGAHWGVRAASSSEQSDVAASATLPVGRVKMSGLT